jgi:hypothetical protein
LELWRREKEEVEVVGEEKDIVDRMYDPEKDDIDEEKQVLDFERMLIRNMCIFILFLFSFIAPSSILNIIM